VKLFNYRQQGTEESGTRPKHGTKKKISGKVEKLLGRGGGQTTLQGKGIAGNRSNAPNYHRGVAKTEKEPMGKGWPVEQSTCRTCSHVIKNKKEGDGPGLRLPGTQRGA